jgi:CRISPR-associated endonuclease/helicase Cas3
MKYYAHSSKAGIPAQEYAVHVRNVHERAAKYAQDTAQYSNNDGNLLIRSIDISSVFHDLGKLDKENQRVLCGELKARSLPKNHVDAGAAHFLRDEELLSAVSVYSHHIGLPDFIEESNRESKIFRDSDLMYETDRLLSDLEKIHNQLIPFYASAIRWNALNY